MKSAVYMKGNDRYNPPMEDSRPNQLFRDYIEPHLPDIKLKESEALDSLEIYILNRHGIPPYIPYRGKIELEEDDEILSKTKYLLKPYVCGNTDLFDFKHCPEYMLAKYLIKLNFGALIIIYGDIGTGKSTLLKFVFNKLLTSLLGDNFIAFIIDALKVPRKTDLTKLTPEDLHEAILQSLESQLIEVFNDEIESEFFKELATKGTPTWNNMKELGFAVEAGRLNKLLRLGKKELFSEEMCDFDKRLLNDKRRLHYNILRLKFLKELRYSKNFQHTERLRRFNKIFLVFDNIDRTSRKTKELTIEIAKYFANVIQVPVIITLRSNVLNRILNAFEGALTEYEHIVSIRLHPPDLGNILAKRFKIYINATQKGKILYKDKYFEPKEAMHEVTTKLANLLIEEKSKDALLAINNGNIRETTNIFLNLLGSSGRVLPLERLIQELADENSVIPFVRNKLPFDYLIEMLALNRKTLYKRNTSLIANLYCCNRIGAGPANNLIKIRILRYLNALRLTAEGTDEVHLGDIIEHLIQLFKYDTKLIRLAIEQLLKDKIIWSRQWVDQEEDKNEESPEVTVIQLRTPGILYNKLRNYLWYICCIKEDCLVPKDVASLISFANYEQKRNHKERYKKEMEHTINFVDYILKIEEEELNKMSAAEDDNWKNIYACHYGHGKGQEQTISEDILFSFRRYFAKKREVIVNGLGSDYEYSRLLTRIDSMIIKAKNNSRTYLS